MKVFSDIVYDIIMEKMNEEIFKSEKEGKDKEYIEGLKKAKALIIECY